MTLLNFHSAEARFSTRFSATTPREREREISNFVPLSVCYRRTALTRLKVSSALFCITAERARIPGFNSSQILHRDFIAIQWRRLDRSPWLNESRCDLFITAWWDKKKEARSASYMYVISAKPVPRIYYLRLPLSETRETSYPRL